jgi:hypothetical protein
MNGRNFILAIAGLICFVGGLDRFFLDKKSAVLPAERIAAAQRLKEKVSSKNIFHAVSVLDFPPADAPDNLTPGEKILAADPADENGRFAELLDELSRAGQFSAALKLAGEASAALQPTLLKIIFSHWAQSNPKDAMRALESVVNPNARSEAFQTIAHIWAMNDPATLADYAISLPSGENQADALQQVVDSWPVLDPAAFATWLNTAPPGVDLDQAIAAMISKADGANYPPEVAMQWVESISDPDLKYNSLLHVLGQWNQNHPAAAQNYVANASWLTDGQQKEILEKLQTPPSDTAANDND